MKACTQSEVILRFCYLSASFKSYCSSSLVIDPEPSLLYLRKMSLILQSSSLSAGDLGTPFCFLFLSQDEQQPIIFIQIIQLIQQQNLYPFNSKTKAVYCWIFICSSIFIGRTPSHSQIELLVMKQQNKYTQLLPFIKRYLIQPEYECCADIESQIFTHPLYFNILGKGIASYATDLVHSIQLQLTSKNGDKPERWQPNPVSNCVTNYYFIYDKQWHPFNCHQHVQDRCQKSETVHPYQPQFYFGKEFADFIEEKCKAKSYFLPCHRIRISKWRLKIVNVSRSGWYAPLIEALDFKTEQQTQKEDFRAISSLLYEEVVQKIMEKMRLKDMRRVKFARFGHEEQLISMLYFLKDAKQFGPKKTTIFAVDRQQTFLTYTESPLTNCVLFGEADGLLALKEPIDEPAIRQDRIRVMSMQNWQILFNKNTLKQERGAFIWSSDQEEEGEEDADGLGAPVVTIDDSDESDEQEDPLRSLYMRQFKTMSLIN